MQLVSLNVGLPRLLTTWQGDTFETGIFKDPIDGRIPLRTTNLDGDRQADLTVHGGPNKAVYGYPSEHYPAWNAELPHPVGAWGAFGENFTTVGMGESTIFIGDRYRLGSTILRVTTPRLPCFKLAAKFKSDRIIEHFLHTERCGFYFAVDQEGAVAAGDEFKLLSRENFTLSIADVNRIYTAKSPDPEILQKSLDLELLPLSWRLRFRSRLDEINRHDSPRP
jgi:MOSC domain-containing protein YiiM